MMKKQLPHSEQNLTDIRLFMPIFLLKKLKLHPLTSGLYPVSLGKSAAQMNFQMKQIQQPSHCLLYCHQGQGKLVYKNKAREINQGDLVIISPNCFFEFYTEIKTTTKQEKQSSEQNSHAIYWINFEGNLACDFAERLLMKMDDGLANVGVLSNILADFDNLLALGRRGYTATNVIHAVHVLQQSLSYLALQLRLKSFNRSSKLDIDAVETLMRDNLHQDLSLDTLAHYAQLSKFHFAKKFKELTDTAPIQHFINMKIQQACRRLDNSDVSIKVIASELGYNDPYYFSRLFKKVIGLSPKQYRDSRHS